MADGHVSFWPLGFMCLRGRCNDKESAVAGEHRFHKPCAANGSVITGESHGGRSLYALARFFARGAEISRGPRAVGKRARNRVIMRGVGHSAKGTPESWAQFFESDRREKT